MFTFIWKTGSCVVVVLLVFFNKRVLTLTSKGRKKMDER